MVLREPFIGVFIFLFKVFLVFGMVDLVTSVWGNGFWLYVAKGESFFGLLFSKSQTHKSTAEAVRIPISVLPPPPPQPEGLHGRGVTWALGRCALLQGPGQAHVASVSCLLSLLLDLDLTPPPCPCGCDTSSRSDLGKDVLRAMSSPGVGKNHAAGLGAHAP